MCENEYGSLETRVPLKDKEKVLEYIDKLIKEGNDNLNVSIMLRLLLAVAVDYELYDLLLDIKLETMRGYKTPVVKAEKTDVGIYTIKILESEVDSNEFR